MTIEIIAENGTQQLHRQRFRSLLDSTTGPLRIASAYVTDTDLLLNVTDRKVQLLTSIAAHDVVAGATNLQSLRTLIESRVQCRIATSRHKFHAKVYIFGDEVAVVTSANLTVMGLSSNIEVGALLTGTPVRELIAWFNSFWRDGSRLDLKTLSEWEEKTALLRREFAALRKRIKKVKVTRKPQPGDSAIVRPGLRNLLETSERFFLCNTDRKHRERTPTGRFLLEDEMRRRHFAAAWEDYRYPSHMERVKRGDAIFMFAKDVGIVGIGRASGEYEVLQKGNRDRINKWWDTPEWRVPVDDDWLAWADEDEDACQLKGPMGTFIDIRGDIYSDLRAKVTKHFLRD